MPNKNESELVLGDLLELYYDDETDVGARLNQALKLGNQHFGTNYAIISHINGPDYTVLYCHTKEDAIKPGQKFNVSDTYCIHTLNAAAPVGFHEAGNSEIASHPCYESFQLETYLGAPINIDKKAFGTVNFSSAAKREKPFNPYDEAFIATIADWVADHLRSSNY